MTKRAGAVLIVFGVGLLGLAAVVSLHSRAHAQSADLVLYNRVAADPAGPDKPADVKGTPEG